MKKVFSYLLIISSILCSLISCSKVTCDVNEQNDLNNNGENYHVSLDQALEQLNIFLDELSINSKSSETVRSYSVKNISTIERDDIFTATKGESLNTSLPEELMYIVNFDNNMGTAVLSADKRTQDIVLCITESGQLHNSDFITANDMLCTIENVTVDPTVLSPNEDYINDLGELTVPSLLLSSVVTSISNYGYMESSNKIGTKALSTATKYGPYVKTKWGQSTVCGNNVFNRYTPNNYPAGCVVIAVAQILLSTSNFTYTSYTGYQCSSKTMQTVCHYTDPYSAGTNDAQIQVGQFVYNLGDSSLLCNVSYGKNGTSGTAAGAKRALEAFLYKNVTKRTGFGSKNQSRATEQIRKGLPVYLGGCKSGSLSGHAWVLDGEWGNYYHINWGWNGIMDGYYSKGVFNTSKRSDKDDVIDTVNGSTTENRNYTWTYRMVTYSL